MAIKALSNAIAKIAMEVHPERIESICAAFASSGKEGAFSALKKSLGSAFSSQLLDDFAKGLKAAPDVTIAELSAMFRVSGETAELASKIASVELVWTGPGTGFIPVRHTAQVLTGLIEEANSRIFLVSFVAYNVGPVVASLQNALNRGVQISILLERSTEHGGNLSMDSADLLKRCLPEALFFEWDKERNVDGGLSAVVHAKCAVADGKSAFVTSANLTEAAMERNMELGVLIKNGNFPSLLEQHLTALITTEHLRMI